jgi:predicted PurR-regulated permease PerM
MKTISEPSALTWLAVVIVTCVFLFLFQKILWLVIPLLLAMVSYYSFRPVVSRLVGAGMRHDPAVRLLMAVLLLVTVGIVLALMPLLAARANDWQAGAERYLQGGQTFLLATIQAVEERVPRLQRAGLSGKLNQEMAKFTEEFTTRYLGPITIGVLEWLPSLLLAPYLTYFLLKDGTRFKRFIIRSVPNAFFEKTLLLFERLDESLQNFFQGMIALTILDTLCLGTGLWLLGISNALVLAGIAALLSWLPYVGSAIGCVLVILVAATDYPGQAGVAYSCLGLFLGVRLLDDFVFLPLTIGRKLRIHPVLSVLMLFLGAAVAGASGLFLALPVLGVVTVGVETIAQIFADQRLRARYRHAKSLTAPRNPMITTNAA